MGRGVPQYAARVNLGADFSAAEPAVGFAFVGCRGRAFVLHVRDGGCALPCPICTLGPPANEDVGGP